MSFDTILQFGLIAACAVLAIFCLVLARRLRKLNDLESGLGSAIAIMSAEVDRLEQSILATKNETRAECKRLQDHIEQARRERAAWDLRRKISEAMPAAAAPSTARRLRKKAEAGHA